MSTAKIIPKRTTPLMGWASWNCFHTNISEQTIKAQADTLRSSRLAEYGYCYVNIDDGFFGGRDAQGKLLFHKERFPNGMRAVSDYIHSLGLKAGIYTDAGDNTCGYYYEQETEGGYHAGCYGHEEEDLRRLLVECNYDFLKVDWCGGLRLELDEEEQYTKIGAVIDQIRKETGREIVYNICRWEFPGAWATRIADSWRTGIDIEPHFASVLYQIDQMKPLARFCRPGHVNDSDMMQIGNGMSLEEEKTHFAMWCMLSTPLMIGGDLTKMSEKTLQILKNRELIALNQDALCRQAVVAKEYRDAQDSLEAEAWVKELAQEAPGNVTKAVALLNRSDDTKEIAFDLKDAGLCGQIVSIRDVCLHQDRTPASALKERVPAHGVCVLRITASDACAYQDCNADAKVGSEKFEKLTKEQADALIQQGAVLVDVRTKQEYDRHHLPGAVNIPYKEIYLHAGQVLADKSQPVIVCCATGKRSCMAKERLDWMGYEQAWYLGGIY